MEEKGIEAAVKRILADSSTCAEAVEIMRPIVSDAALLRKFDGFSADAVTALQNILCRYALLSLCRMWDQSKDAQSIPSVRSILPTLKDPTKATHQRIDQVVRVVDQMLESERLERLRNWRNKNLGHALVVSCREKKKGPVTDPKWEDIFVFERRSCVIVEAIASAAAGIAIDSAEQREIYSRNTQAFWSSFVERPGRREGKGSLIGQGVVAL